MVVSRFVSNPRWKEAGITNKTAIISNTNMTMTRPY